MGSALASAVLTALLTRNYIPGLAVALPRAHQYTLFFLTGVGATVLCALLVAVGLRSHRLRPGEGAGTKAPLLAAEDGSLQSVALAERAA
ncbi:hypothetical protein [Streptomyces sp. NPDC004533]|uniref:hypothetical protein n=1 Tax=Streptomyces sp. NPDC004533 TaxID=3154278 RepID=UPI0033B65436